VYIRNFNQNISQVANISNVLQQTAAAAERVFEFLDEEEESRDTDESVGIDGSEKVELGNSEKKKTAELEVRNLRGTADLESVHSEKKTADLDVRNLRGIVDFENVKFGYSENKIVINDFSCHVEEGQKIAVVGPTGAGKTTIVKLLMRFYELNGGRILIDGYDIKDFKRDGLRSMFGMVLQDTWLFNDTIMENIRYGRSDATDEEVVIAAATAHADRFIRSLPGGYNMPLNEDATNISQGQKQLLTIARAILADPKILILDEATSSVDTRTEILIQNAMDALMKNRTSFVIAHRLSTIKNADVILVLKDGDIVESGNHEKLMAQGGFYSELYRSQFTQSDA
jgi:ATP-binding cassette subfamily B protein